MTQTTIGTRAGIAARISAWVRRCQRELSARVHAAADERARRHGWTVTETTGRFGFGGRIYRDPRFDDRRRELSSEAGPSRTRSEAASAVSVAAYGLGEGRADPGLTEDQITCRNENDYQPFREAGE